MGPCGSESPSVASTLDERRRRAERTDAQRIEDKKKERDCHAELTDEERLIQKKQRGGKKISRISMLAKVESSHIE